MTAVARTTGKKVILSESGHLWVGDDCYLPKIEPEGVFPVRPHRRTKMGDCLEAAEINWRYGCATQDNVLLLRAQCPWFRMMEEEE
jgi:hypothetical protein